jgi:tetratricopeptide (TPR) repeat protein
MFQEALEDPKNAIDYYLEAIRINEKHFLSFYQMAFCYQKLGDVRSAEKYYRKSLDISPGFEKAQQQLDQLLLDNKKYK